MQAIEISGLECDSVPVPVRELDHEEVRVHLARILESSGFVKADRLCRFLRFTVEAKLNGEGDQIKEYVLGREVFDRNGDYDPRVDSIVRVEARRLRTRLEEYYSGTGRSDTVRIEFPKGSYIPVIHLAEVAATGVGEPQVVQGKRLGLWISGAALLLALLISVAFAGYHLRQPLTAEIVAVAPSGWLWGETADAVTLEETLAERVGMELARQNVARVVGWPLMLPYRTGQPEFRQMAAGLGAAKVLLIRAGNSDVAVFALSANSNEKIWVGQYSRNDEAELARSIVQDFAAKEKDTATVPK
jgi:hypothetical protein